MGEWRIGGNVTNVKIKEAVHRSLETDYGW